MHHKGANFQLKLLHCCVSVIEIKVENGRFMPTTSLPLEDT